MNKLKRGAGILLSVTSLPSRYGIGTLGEEAYRFVDLLVDLKQKYWQVLPVGPTGVGDSPYQSFSAFAGNPYMIDLDILVGDNLISVADINEYSFGSDEALVDYSALFEHRFKVLRKAYERFDTTLTEYADFCKKNSFWLEDYSLYMAIKEASDNRKWQDWEARLREHDKDAVSAFATTYKRDVEFWKFLQYEFFLQWEKLRKYANERGILIIGEVPLYVSEDSADVWAHRELFKLNAEGYPENVAGCPPDAFSKGGQKWGNPLYDWEEMENNHFKWWHDRIGTVAGLYDVIRINHFVGVVKDYSVPADNEDARGGKWHKGPGKKLTDVIEQAAGDAVIIVEDFGTVVIPVVRKLMNKLGWPGMKVLLFAFDENPMNTNLPHNYEDGNSVVYGTTHDSDTLVGYFKDKNDYQLGFLYEYLGVHSKEEISDAFIKLAYSSVANVVIIQMQDILKYGNEARMNCPSTVGGNWRWRLVHNSVDEKRREWLRTLSTIYRR